MKVKVTIDWCCDIDVSDLNSSFIDVNGFAKDEAKRFFLDELKNDNVDISVEIEEE